MQGILFYTFKSLVFKRKLPTAFAKWILLSFLALFYISKGDIHFKLYIRHKFKYSTVKISPKGFKSLLYGGNFEGIFKVYNKTNRMEPYSMH